MNRDQQIRALLQEVVRLRMEGAPASEHSGSVTVNFKELKVRKVHWQSFDDADQWEEVEVAG